MSLHSIVSGAAFNALFRFCQLLEQVIWSVDCLCHDVLNDWHSSTEPTTYNVPQVFDVLDRPTSRVLGTINFQLRSRKQAGFMLSRDWLKLLDVKVSILFFPSEILEQRGYQYKTLVNFYVN